MRIFRWSQRLPLLDPVRREAAGATVHEDARGSASLARPRRRVTAAAESVARTARACGGAPTAAKVEQTVDGPPS